MERSIDFEVAIATLGEVLESRGIVCEIVAIGGGAMGLLGLIARPTKDIDILAIVRAGQYETASPLPDELAGAIADVAVALSIPADWMNPGPTDLLRFGLPKGFEKRVQTRQYGSLVLHLADRFDQICFKFYAAVDQFPDDKHLKDLRLLQPTREELLAAAAWSRSHDPSPDFHEMSRQALAHFGAEEEVNVG